MGADFQLPTDILEVIGQHVALRKQGREHVGLCPFHAEKTPSFSVNADKGVFYCRGCGLGGDLITFVQKFDGCDFATAARRLGRNDCRPSPARMAARAEAKQIVWWARAVSAKVRGRLREIGAEILLCRTARRQAGTDWSLIAQHEAGLVRQWAILCDLDDDLFDSRAVVELWRQRADIEALIEGMAA
jgi:CHC2 zinc finger